MDWIKASAEAQGNKCGAQGRFFVLDMGEPVKISELAHTMINLAGKSIQNEENPGGEIAMEYSGLRPDEKFYEELLICDIASPASHPRIQKPEEPFKKMTC